MTISNPTARLKFSEKCATAVQALSSFDDPQATKAASVVSRASSSGNPEVIRELTQLDPADDGLRDAINCIKWFLLFGDAKERQENGDKLRQLIAAAV